MDAAHRPKIAETMIDPTVRLREADIGRRCEILANTRVEYSALGDYSYLGENCDIAGCVIGKFTAIANSVRIGAPNHPMGRPSQHRFTYVPEYYEPTAVRDRDFFASRRAADRSCRLATPQGRLTGPRRRAAQKRSRTRTAQKKAASRWKHYQ